MTETATASQPVLAKREGGVRVLLVAPSTDEWHKRADAIRAEAGVELTYKATPREVTELLARTLINRGQQMAYDLVILSEFDDDVGRPVQTWRFIEMCVYFRTLFEFEGYILGVADDESAHVDAMSAAPFSYIITRGQLDDWIPGAFTHWPSSLMLLIAQDFL
jgi:hypothetical protein